MSREKSAHHMVVQRMNSGRREKRPSIEGYIAGTLQAYGIRKGILGQVWARIAGMPGVRFLAIEDSNHRAGSENTHHHTRIQRYAEFFGPADHGFWPACALHADRSPRSQDVAESS